MLHNIDDIKYFSYTFCNFKICNNLTYITFKVKMKVNVGKCHFNALVLNGFYLEAH